MGYFVGNHGTGVRASISKPTPFIYLAFEKNGPIHILDRLKWGPIHILLFSVPIYCLYLVSYSSHFIEYQALKGAGGGEAFISRKTLKKDILGRAEKGAMRHAHPYYTIYRQ